jgi:hypothetical protein
MVGKRECKTRERENKGIIGDGRVGIERDREERGERKEGEGT